MIKKGSYLKIVHCVKRFGFINCSPGKKSHIHKFFKKVHDKWYIFKNYSPGEKDGLFRE
jgi:hypothetical protein